MKLQPLYDRVIVKPEEKETKTPSRLILPDTAQERPLRGTVVAVGPGKLLDNGKILPMDVKEGDVVLYGKYAGTEVKIDGEEYVILRQDDILAIDEGAKKKKSEKVTAEAK
ncbi:MAG TPA: co-chaperone GroES [Fimbriimonadales bacterium]|nr:co-chaperone GroES [Fimbriimonadales bacterium]